MTDWGDFFGLFILLAGNVIGLGAVIVVDLHVFLGRRSRYWAETAIRVHKVTKPLIWMGIALVLIGGAIFYRGNYSAVIPLVQAVVVLLLILNRLFLTYRVSPFLLAREEEDRAGELLSASWQRKMAAASIVSIVGWWGSLGLLVWYVVGR
jgi:hypothetical protein